MTLVYMEAQPKPRIILLYPFITLTYPNNKKLTVYPYSRSFNKERVYARRDFLSQQPQTGLYPYRKKRI